MLKFFECIESYWLTKNTPDQFFWTNNLTEKIKQIENGKNPCRPMRRERKNLMMSMN